MGSLLQELGAEVIKIEQPTTGDPSRTVSPWGFLNYNLGKKSLSLNLKSETGREILHRLIRKKADIFIENLGPHVSDELGFSYKALSKIKPSLVYCSIKGFSKNSKDYERPAFDAVAQAMSGVMSLTGEPYGEPVRIGNPATDLAAAAYGTIQVLGALLEKKGKFIEISLLDMSVYWNGYWLTYFGMTGKVPRLLGSGHPGYSPHKVFKTKDDRWVFVATLSDAQWKKLSTLLKLNLDARHDEMKFRIDHRKEVESTVQAAILRFDSKELVELLRTDVPSAKVRSIDEIYNDDELEITQDVSDVSGKKVRVVKSPFGSESGKKRTNLRVPKLGEQNNQILTSLGYRSSEIKEFRRAGIV